MYLHCINAYVLACKSTAPCVYFVINKLLSTGLPYIVPRLAKEEGEDGKAKHFAVLSIARVMTVLVVQIKKRWKHSRTRDTCQKNAKWWLKCE